MVVDDPAWHAELRRLAPWTDLSGPAEKDLMFLSGPGGDGVEGAMRGAQAAIDAIRQVLAT